MPGGNARLGDHPPKPRLALTVGVIGHRPNRLPKDSEALGKLSNAIKSALEAVAKAATAAYCEHKKYFEGGPDLTIVSALAEGVDRMAVRAAFCSKEFKFWLDAPLPFSRNLYEMDFANTAGAVDEFDELLNHEKKRAVLWLPGRKTPNLKKDERDIAAERSYESGGLTVLSQADLILAVFDGKGSAGRGGTAEILTATARSGTPIILLNPNTPEHIQIRWSGLDKYPVSLNSIDDLTEYPFKEATIQDLVTKLVRPPKGSERESLKSYLSAEYRGRVKRFAYPLLLLAFDREYGQPIWEWLKTKHRSKLTFSRFQRLWQRSKRRLSAMFPDPQPQVSASQYASLCADVGGGDVGILADAYGWADAIAVRFAQMFRSAFVSNFSVAALAVACSAGSVAYHSAKVPLVVIELGLIAWVVYNTSSGRKQGWHRRWLEARELAERLRVALPLWALGIRPVIFYAGEEPTWTGWYARAIVRSQGLRSGDLNTPGAMDAARAVMAKLGNCKPAEQSRKGLLEDQCEYNRSNVMRMERLGSHLETVGMSLFITTAVVAAIFLTYAFGTWLLCLVGRVDPFTQFREHLEQIVTALTAGLPALATAIYGFRLIGDFEGVAHRSERTQAILQKLIGAIEHDPLELHLLRARAQMAAEAMLVDVSNWRLAAESRGLDIPG